MIIEIIVVWRNKKDYINFVDAVGSVSSALLNQASYVFTLYLAHYVYAFLNQYSLTKIPNTFLSLLAIIFVADFIYYWFHRAGHTFNILWAFHAPHHTSIDMSFFTAVRTGIFQRAASILFMWPIALIGFQAEWVVLGISVNLMMHFWQHTRIIHRMPKAFEKIFNSPAHHRVHHGVNPQYLDKNFAGVLIIWDKMFGTFEEEVEEVEYGTLTPIPRHDALTINFFFLNRMLYHAYQLPGLKNKIIYVFGFLNQVPKWKNKYDLKEMNIKSIGSLINFNSNLKLTVVVALLSMLSIVYMFSKSPQLSAYHQSIIFFLGIVLFSLYWRRLMFKRVKATSS